MNSNPTPKMRDSLRFRQTSRLKTSPQSYNENSIPSSLAYFSHTHCNSSTNDSCMIWEGRRDTAVVLGSYYKTMKTNVRKYQENFNCMSKNTTSWLPTNILHQNFTRSRTDDWDDAEIWGSEWPSEEFRIRTKFPDVAVWLEQEESTEVWLSMPEKA